ncbi:hypothetical protein [Actinomadura parmotrematis]|uniref:Uncharacterized protein n=1 Tax=Actinomadura parmotrematis TaxID=2864039 RepID=A0ABS7FRX2_9ACTN|nr:hypothetical protein [Actinomadura parmotrematis]MBW8483153.1 hypothetical protein [Actinomadura parmotrematis]
MKRHLPLLALLAGALTACGAGTGAFQTGAAPYPLPCMRHQTARPSGDYARDSARGLTVLRYYTANAPRGYCDRKDATGADRAWIRLYLKLGADPAPVRPLLASR